MQENDFVKLVRKNVPKHEDIEKELDGISRVSKALKELPKKNNIKEKEGVGSLKK